MIYDKNKSITILLANDDEDDSEFFAYIINKANGIEISSLIK